ncbi:MAG TPA: GNAT family N-acetyltransferase [Caulobacteraceae bacterium]|nr:GNAT family N-acetyltransferase [Caulobacteraceae bacterium]
MKSSKLRVAHTEDAEILTSLGRRTFSATFGHLYPPEDLQTFLDEAHTPALYRAWAADPAYGLWVCEADGEVIGYALAGPNTLPHPNAEPGDGELKRIYVAAEAQGLGAGSGLLAVALDWLERLQRPLWIGVWSENHGAQRLYARQGFVKAGEYEFPVGRSRDHEFIMRRGPIERGHEKAAG